MLRQASVVAAASLAASECCSRTCCNTWVCIPQAAAAPSNTTPGLLIMMSAVVPEHLPQQQYFSDEERFCVCIIVDLMTADRLLLLCWERQCGTRGVVRHDNTKFETVPWSFHHLERPEKEVLCHIHTTFEMSFVQIFRIPKQFP